MNWKQVKSIKIKEGDVKSLSINSQVVWKKEEKPPVVVNSFYIEDASGQPNTLSLTKTGTEPDIKLEYSNDGSVWKEWVDCQTTTLPVAANSKVYLRGTNNTFTYYGSYYNIFNCTGRFNVGGDITTLLVPEGNVLDLTGRDGVFICLFRGSNVVDACKLQLPATTLIESCYYGMFEGCTSLATTPELPATTLADWCYGSMFSGCKSLTVAPELPATTLASSCYGSMFSGCKSLTVAPELPVTTLASSCYGSMFRECTSLTTTPELPATKLDNSCYNGMFENCTSLITTMKIIPATDLRPYCYNNMFYGCKSLKTAPELPATTLTSYCYSNMFKGCSKLNYVKIGTTTWNKSHAIDWLDLTASAGTFVKPAELVTWDGTGTQPEGSIPLNSTSGIPSGWTVEDINPKPVEDHRFRFYNPGDQVNTLSNSGSPSFETSTDGVNWTPSTTFTSMDIQPKGTLYLRGKNASMNYKTFKSTQPIECHGSVMDLCDGGTGTTEITQYSQFQEMFKGMETLLTAPELPATTLNDYCYRSMFFGCTSLTTAPKELPATTLASNCYNGMFFGCTSLTTAPELPATNIDKQNCYASLFGNCSKLNYVKVGATTWSRYARNWVYGVSPTGTFIKPATLQIGTDVDQISENSANGIPSGWTVEEF